MSLEVLAPFRVWEHAAYDSNIVLLSYIVYLSKLINLYPLTTFFRKENIVTYPYKDCAFLLRLFSFVSSASF